MRLTFERIMALRPCWTPEAVADYFGGRKYVYHTTVLRDPALPHSDRIWLAIRLMPDDNRRLFACDCAERALKYVPDGEERPRHAIEVARRFAYGEATASELDAACDAAWAARTAAGHAARSSARSSASAASSASGAAARSAACDAASAAACASAWVATERDWQIERAIDYLEES